MRLSLRPPFATLYLGGWALLALSAPVALAQSLPEASPSFSPLPTEADPTDADTGRSRLTLSLPDLIELVVTGNRDLRDRRLQRLVQRQQLLEAEARFDPRFTPTAGISLSQSFSDLSPFGGISAGGLLGTETELGDRTAFNQSLGLLGEVTTRQGTEIGLTVDLLADTPVGLRLTQPLLRDAGIAVNEAPVAIARLQASQNSLELQQTLIETVTTTVTQYTSLIQAQETVAIQQQAVSRRRQQLEIESALVAAGRRAEVSLADTRRALADAERDLLLAQTQLEQANTALLDQVGTEETILFVASAETITELFTVAEARIETFVLEELVAIAYQRRPDYRQAELDQTVAQLDQLQAEDDLRWRLDVEGNADFGDLSETTVGLVARRTFDEPALETESVRSQVAVRQAENRLAQQQTAIRNEVTNQLNTVRANLARVEAARRAVANARLQLEVTQELFRRGRLQGDVFQLINQEENLVQAQNRALEAEIEFLNSIARLDRAVGITLDTWSRDVDFQPALQVPDSLDQVSEESP